MDKLTSQPMLFYADGTVAQRDVKDRLPLSALMSAAWCL